MVAPRGHTAEPRARHGAPRRRLRGACARAGGEELAFAAETFVAATELHNLEHERARRACVRACHLAVATLPGDAGEIRSLAEALTSAARADGTKRALIVVSPPRAVVGRATRVVGVGVVKRARS